MRVLLQAGLRSHDLSITPTGRGLKMAWPRQSRIRGGPMTSCWRHLTHPQWAELMTQCWRKHYVTVTSTWCHHADISTITSAAWCRVRVRCVSHVIQVSCVCVCACVCLCVCLCVCVCMCERVCVCVCMCEHGASEHVCMRASAV